MSGSTTNTTNPDTDDELDATIIIAIVVGSTGFVLMMLGAVYYLSRLGDVPSRKSVATAPQDQQQQQQQWQPTTATKDNKGDEEGADMQIREELIEIYAPAGKLGVVLEDSPSLSSTTANNNIEGEATATSKTTNNGGPPLVHTVRTTSVLKSELHVGDRVIALDDEDVRKMTANTVSKMISRKMEQTTRKLSIIRTMRPLTTATTTTTTPNV